MQEIKSVVEAIQASGDNGGPAAGRPAAPEADADAAPRGSRDAAPSLSSAEPAVSRTPAPRARGRGASGGRTTPTTKKRKAAD